MTKAEAKAKCADVAHGLDWHGLLKAVLRSIWPFVVGAIGGLVSGCTAGGIGPNFCGA